MRLFELLLTMASATLFIRLASIPKAGGVWLACLQGLLAVLLIAQLALEGWRWQMLPAYAVAAVAIGGTPYLGGLGAPGLFWSATASMALLAATIMSCLLLPFVPQRPPHGPFAVGVTTLCASLLRTPDFGSSDELQAAPLVRLWYPAEAPARWPRFRSTLEERFANRLRTVPDVVAAPDAAVVQATGRLPVVIYFAGWPEDRIQNRTLILELASRGFVVASVQYPGIVPGTSYRSHQQQLARLARPMLDYSSDAAFERTVQLDHARARAHARDAVALLDALSALDHKTGNRFSQRLDIQRTGLVGFSFGGAVAAEASRLEPRFKAVVNMDGRHWGDALEHGVEQPYLFLCEDLRMPTAAEIASIDPMTRYEARLDQTDYSQLAAHLQAQGGIRVTIAGTAHMNFTDDALRSPLRRLSGGGPIDARRAQEIIQTYVIEFLLRYLVAGDPPPLDSPLPQFPEVRVQSWRAPQRNQRSTANLAVPPIPMADRAE